MLPDKRLDPIQPAGIRRVVEQRGITDLYHFTRAENFESILRHGILSVSTMQARGIRHWISDPERWDGRLNGISVSISFPNWSMFYKKRTTCDRPTHWVVLSISPSILWTHKVEFYSNNAAAGGMITRKRSAHCGAAAFRKLFEGPTRASEKGTPLPSRFPTNNQAEVMVFESIRQRYIRYCVVGTEAIWNYARKLHPPFDVLLSRLRENGDSIDAGVFSTVDYYLNHGVKNHG